MLNNQGIANADGQSGGSPAATQPVLLGGTWMLSAVAPDTLIGGIRIPTIGVEAPLLQGTDDPELDVGAGHLVTSAWPGQNGTSVIAAHNATWFRHIDRLHAGDAIQVWTKQGLATFKVTQSQVVHTGDPIANTTSSSLILEACYPLNALYLTPYRYLVMGNWVSTQGAGASTDMVTDSHDTLYHAEVPQDLISEGLTLTTNTLPMGSLGFTGHPTDTYTQSRSPLSASSTLTQLYLAWVHACSDRNDRDLWALSPPSLKVKNPRLDDGGDSPQSTLDSSVLYGVPLQSILYDDRFDVTLDVDGNVLRSATGSTILDVHGEKYRVTVNASLDDQHVMHLSNFTILSL